MSLLLFSLIILYISVCLAKVENLVVFGDSYSDVGNVQQNSNGPLWSENLAVAWNASLYSFAFSGSTCDDSNKMTSTAPSIVDQIEMYYNQQLNLEPENTVYAFWIGYSDLHNMIKKNDKEYDKVLDCLMQQVANVRKVFGTNRFILFTLAPMDKMPYFSKDESESEKRKEAVDTFNQLLHEKFLNLVKYHNTLELDLVDVHDLLVDMIDSPAEFGFSEGDQAYWDACQGKCLDAIDDYIWWDKLHLTGGAHRAITTSILMSNSLEPSVTLPSSTTIHDLLNQPDSQFKSPIYEASYHTGLIDKVLKKLKDVKEKETTKENENENEKQEN
ncbi:GDSL-like Lipase/Acylhydrolase-domain-containing protein, partial [Cunninghamella echinulata]